MVVLGGSTDMQKSPALYRSTDLVHINLSLPKPASKYPAKQHARNVAARLPSNGGLIHLEGMYSQYYEESDQSPKFRQRRDFLYLSGVTDIPNCELLYCIESDELTLFIPPLDPGKVQWTGMPSNIEECLEKYDVDFVALTPQLPKCIGCYLLKHPTSPVYTLPNSTLENANKTSLKPALNTARVYKDAHEIALLRHANKITAAAHDAVHRALRNPQTTNETHLEAVYIGTCVSAFAKTQGYDPIFGSGPNAATLHYTHNNEPLLGRQLLLCDAGAEWEGYTADVTRTFPISGSFTREGAAIYKLVEEMQARCIAETVAGNNWKDVHLLAHRIAVRGLLGLGILYGGTEDEIFAAGTSKAFFPHGLGHMLGLDVHDVELPLSSVATAATAGVYATIEHPLKGGASTLVTRVLEENMVITVEPGIYFCAFVIRPYMRDPVHGGYINGSVLKRYWDVGGVRIEDDILVLAHGKGNENLTTAPLGEGAELGRELDVSAQAV